MKAYELPESGGTVQCLADDIYKWAEAKGFWKDEVEIVSVLSIQPELLVKLFHMKKCQKLMLIISEIAELMEGLRLPTEEPLNGIFTNEEEEAADIMIRLLDYCGRYKLRIVEALVAKMAKNENRPYMHGKGF